VVANQKEMAKRKKEKYLKKRQRSWQWPSMREAERLKAREGDPIGKNRKILLGRTNVHTVRKKDIGKINALTREKKER
jgi:hypothetical protein